MKTFNGVRLIRTRGHVLLPCPISAPSAATRSKLSKFLLKKAMVVTVPGKEFGMEGHIRISFAARQGYHEGIARIKWALDPTSPNEIYIGDKKMIRDWM